MISIRNLIMPLALMCLLPLASVDSQQRDRAKRPANPAMRPIEDDPNLPRVLLIGDSISIGYTQAVRERLKGIANVHRPLENCGPTLRGLKKIDQWLGDKPWDVIHFNWGLHDLKYLGPQGQNLADPTAADSHQQVPPDTYEENLQKLVTRLKQTDATLIWCSTTPIPRGARGRVPGDSRRYNQIAATVMKSHQVKINDLYGFAQPRMKEIQNRADVHFTANGSRQLGKQVADAIEQALKTDRRKIRLP